MAIKLRTKRPNTTLKRIVEALKDYAVDHPTAEIEAYRQNSVSVRIRIVDSTFAGKSRAAREDDLWGFLDRLPEEVVAEISLLLLLTPDEVEKSFANFEFENPIPSKR